MGGAISFPSHPSRSVPGEAGSQGQPGLGRGQGWSLASQGR